MAAAQNPNWSSVRITTASCCSRFLQFGKYVSPDFKYSQEERALIYVVFSLQTTDISREHTPPTEKETTTGSRKNAIFCLKPLTLSWFKSGKCKLDVVPKESGAKKKMKKMKRSDLACSKTKTGRCVR